MGILDKLTFWKKKETNDFNDSFNNDSFSDISNDPFKNFQQKGNGLNNMDNPYSKNLDYDDDFSQNLNLKKPYDPEDHSTNDDNFNMTKPFEMKEKPMVPQQQNNGDLLNKNIEIISSKLDTLKAELDSMNQRLIGIEAASRKNEKEPTRRYQW